MSNRLAPHIEALIRQKVDNGSYRSADDVIEDAQLALDEREQTRLLRLRAMVREGFESGEGIPVIEDVMDEIEREAEAAHRRGETPNPDVCPIRPLSASRHHSRHRPFGSGHRK